ncbi:MAG: SLBB domain-containing protein [Muribaculaceae bacterium]|nr:SLBB domain-containing protein [Muribaculaceae bacterium]
MKLRNLLTIGVLAVTLAASALTDNEVIQYIRVQSANGKTEQEIGRELMAQGVTPDQVRRIRAKYKRDNVSTESAAQSATLRDKSRNSESTSRDADEETIYQQDVEVKTNQFTLSEEDSKEVFGRAVFNSQALTFEPNTNMATPKDYRLGPGDEVIIDVWGAAEEHLREKISPEGSIMISRLGPVHLNGKTIDEANAHIRNLFARKYAGVTDQQTDVSVNLGDIRSIQVDIMGEVTRPGTFRMSPFSNVFHALYNAGGISDIGSMRNITVLRNNRKIANVDIYDYLFKGKQTGNIRLQEGDVIIVPPYEQIVNISGNVKRPMYYEVKQGETLSSLLDYAGGFTGDAYSGVVRLSRQNGSDNDLYVIEKGEFGAYQLQDGDVITVGNVLDRFSNRVEVKGAVTRPGLYALGNGITTLRELISKAEGLTDDAYQGRALIYREGPDLTLEVVPVDLGAVINGTAEDITLQKNDVIDISSIQTIDQHGPFTITGMVNNPGEYPFANNTSVEDLILRAGGLREGASTVRVEVSRRVYDPTDVTESQRIAERYTVNIAGGLGTKRSNKSSEFILEPYDQVIVRTAPNYRPQEFVEIKGEVLFPGVYTLAMRNQRLSDLVTECGGIVEGAYIKGAYLKRKLSESEYQERARVVMLARQNAEGTDSISIDKLNLEKSYSVGIDLPMALAHPGSSYDLVLQPGDMLYVPEEQSTVKVSGDVMFPNTVVYQPGQKVKYYIGQSGGYGDRAKKSKAFIIYMNGQVAKVGRNTVVEPGSHIIVPSKQPSTTNVWEKIIPVISGVGSLATMGASLATLFKK